LIARYTRREMGAVWSDQNRFQQWLEVELAAAEALAELGVIPPEDAILLRRHAAFDAARIFETPAFSKSRRRPATMWSLSRRRWPRPWTRRDMRKRRAGSTTA
jgi:hypothetical protein